MSIWNNLYYQQSTPRFSPTLCAMTSHYFCHWQCKRRVNVGLTTRLQLSKSFHSIKGKIHFNTTLTLVEMYLSFLGPFSCLVVCFPSGKVDSAKIYYSLSSQNNSWNALNITEWWCTSNRIKAAWGFTLKQESYFNNIFPTGSSLTNVSVIAHETIIIICQCSGTDRLVIKPFLLCFSW